MKRNLNDYKKEMKALETRYHALGKKSSSEVNHISFQKREQPVKVPSSTKWTRLIPVLMAIVMAIITLILLIISEVLKNH
jgi:hypothetical protein